MVDTGDVPDSDESPLTVGAVPDDTEIPDEAVDRTEHAPLAQWASRAAGRPQPQPEEIQAPVDPWPLPIHGLIPPPDAAPIDELTTLHYDANGRPVLLPVPKRRRRGLVAAVAAGAVAILAVAGGVTAAMWPESTSSAAQPAPAGPGSAPAPALSETSPSPVAVGDDAAPMPSGPIPQGVMPDSIYAMDELCKGVTYWPLLPKRTGNKGPHPILIYGDKADSARLPYGMFYTWIDGPKSLKAVWAGDDPSKIRLMACVDRVAAGSKVRFCPSNPYAENPTQLTLYRASYRIRLYETATATKLLDTRLDAKDTSCPNVGSEIPDGKKIYMEITDKAFESLLRKFVGR